MQESPHWSEEKMVLHYYGEGDGGELARHLAECSECRDQFRLLQRVLNTVNSAPAPERPANYEELVWKRLEPKLGRRGFWRWLQMPTPRTWAAAGALAVLLVTAFLAGRYTSPKAGPMVAANPKQVRERVLVIAVGNHLDRSQMLLLELANSPDGRRVNISTEQQTAEDLLEENRLYRQTALKTGDTRVAAVLDGLERVLLEIAHSPETLDPAQVQTIRHEIEDGGVLFQLQVLNSRLKQQSAKPVTGSARL